MVLRKKYKGSTLPEVMIALSIISICATLAVIIYLNIQQGTTPFIRIKANELASKYMKEAILKKEYFDNSYSEEEYTVTKKISSQNTGQDIKITIMDINHKKLEELHAFVQVQ
jgi:prepilin-type N-terminal cleavage/methylation domain-containing protein